MAEGRNLIAIRHGSNLSQAFEDGKRPIENFELGFDVENGVLYIGVNDDNDDNTYQAVGANFGKDVVLTAKNGGTGQKIEPEEGKIVFSYFDQNGGRIVETSASGTLYTIKEEDENGNSSITVMHGILPPAAGGTGLSEILPNSFVYGGVDGNLVSIAPGKNTEGDTDFNAGVPIFEVDSVKTGIVPLQFGGLGENSENFDLGLLYLTNITVEDDVAKRVFRTVKNPNGGEYLIFNGESPAWVKPPFVRKYDDEVDPGVMIYSGPNTDGDDVFSTISELNSGFLYLSSDKIYGFKSIGISDISGLQDKLDSYVPRNELNLDDYQSKIDATGILVRTGEAITGVSGNTDNTYLSYNGGSYNFVSIEAGPTISGTGLLYAVSGADTPDQVEIKGVSFPESNSLVAIESSKITYLKTLPLSYYDIPLEGQGDIKNGNDDVWSFIWGKYEVSDENSPPKLIELSSWGPKEDTEGAVTKFLGLDKNNNFYWTSSLPTTTLVFPSNLKYVESGTANSIVGIVDGADQFIKVDPSTFGKTYTQGFGISIEEGTISVNISGEPGVLWYWDNALKSYSIEDGTSNLYLAAYDGNKFMYRYNTGDGIVTLENGIITLVSKEEIGGSDINIGSGSGYLWKDEQKGTISPTTYISSVTIGQNGYGTTFDAKYITLDGVGTAGSSSKLLFMNNSGNIVSSSETIGNMPTITLPGSNESGGWVWMDTDGSLESRSITNLTKTSGVLSQKGLLFTDSEDNLLEFYGTGTAGYLYTDVDGNISISTPSGGASYIAGDGINIVGSTISVDLSASDIPSLSASKITEGTFSYLRIRNSTKVYTNNEGWKLCWVSNSNSTPKGSAFKTFADNSTNGRSFSVLFIDDQGYIWY